MAATLPTANPSIPLGTDEGASPSAAETRNQFLAVRWACGLIDLRSRAKLILSGEDRTRWLNGMLTNNVRDLSPGHGVYAFLLNPQGHILGDLYAFQRGEYILVDTDASQLEKIRSTFDHYIIMDDVEVTDAREKLVAIGIAGPTSRGVLSRIGFEVPELAPLQIVDLTWHDVGVTLLRRDNSVRDSYEIWLGPENFDRLWNALRDAGAVPVGPEAGELIRIGDGVPRYGQDIRERDLPQETEQGRALHFSKGCYVGQEIVERIRSRGGVHRTFTGFTVDGPLPAPGAKIQADGKDVGEITSAASLPVGSGDQRVALGYIRKEAVNKNLVAGETNVAVAALPFAVKS
jgi:folate-binding protein YgfZ